MKTITLVCAILWTIATFFSIYTMILGPSPLFELFSLSPIYAIKSIVWLFTNGAMALFFFTLWGKQS